VLEQLTGESLRERLQHDRPLEQRATLWIARQIAEGLQAVHHAGFVHGDVKPDNVQIEANGRAVLLDLGFAHRPNEVGSLEEEGFLLGTLNYIAPERADRSQTETFAADWFSFGVMLHEMLTVALPHAPRTMEEFLHQTVPISHVIDFVEMPTRLMELLTGLLNPLPSARPRGPFVIHELIALEIAALSHRRAS
jgi:serine/threonine protein kinase